MRECRKEVILLEYEFSEKDRTMRPLSHLDAMLSEYQSVCKCNNFNHFQTFVQGLIFTEYRDTMTQIYQSKNLQEHIGVYRSFYLVANGVLTNSHPF